MWDRVELFLIAFPSSYLVERAFSAILTLPDSKRNRLEIVNLGELRLFLTKLKLDIDKLICKTSASSLPLKAIEFDITLLR